MALVSTAREAGAPMRIVETVISVNDARKQGMADRIVEACGGSVAGKTVAVLGLTFKPNTDDMRDSPSLEILPGLVERGARVRAYDPQGLAAARNLLNGVDWCEDAFSALDGADCLAVVTEWNEFRALDLARVKSLLKTPVVVDLRNVYRPAEMRDAGFDYYSIGRAPVRAGRRVAGG